MVKFETTMIAPHTQGMLVLTELPCWAAARSRKYAVSVFNQLPLNTETSNRITSVLHAREAEIKSGEVHVFMEDECHLLSGDTSGYVWGKQNERIEVPIKNSKERRTYYGVIDRQWFGQFLGGYTNQKSKD